MFLSAAAESSVTGKENAHESSFADWESKFSSVWTVVLKDLYRQKMFASITCDLYAVHINFQSLSFICVDTQNQFIFHFLNCYLLGKIKVEGHNNTSNIRQKRWLDMQDSEENPIYDVSHRQYLIPTQLPFTKSEYLYILAG